MSNQLTSSKTVWKCAVCSRFSFGYSEENKFVFFTGRAAPTTDDPNRIEGRCPLCTFLNAYAAGLDAEVIEVAPPLPEPQAAALAEANAIDLGELVGTGWGNQIVLRDIKDALRILAARERAKRESGIVNLGNPYVPVGQPLNVPKK